MQKKKYYTPAEERHGKGKRNGGPIIGRVELCYDGKVVRAAKYHGRANRKQYIEKFFNHAKRRSGAYITIIPE